MALRISLLSGFRICAADGRDLTPRGAKARALLALLALERSGRVERRRAAETLWSPPRDPLVNLRQLLRALAGQFGQAGLSVVEADRSSVRLVKEAVDIDVDTLERISHADRLPEPAVLAALQVGEPLDGLDLDEPVFEDWLLERRAELRRMALLALGRVLERSRAAGQAALAEMAAHNILKLEPASEEAYRALMELAEARGDKGAAIAHYEGCVEALSRLVDAEPDAETVALMNRIRMDRLVIGALAPTAEPAAAEPRSSAPHPPEPLAGSGAPVGPAALGVSSEPPKLRIRLNGGWAGAAADVSGRVGAAIEDAICEAVFASRWMFSVVDDPDDAVDVQYELLGRIRPGQAATSVSARLVDAVSRTVVWAKRFETPHDSFSTALRSNVSAIAAALEREVMVKEIGRSWAAPPERLDRHMRIMLAIPLIFRLTPASLTYADRLLASAAEEHGGAATPLAWRAFVGFLRLGQGCVSDVQAGRQEISSHVRHALEIEPDNALALAVAGHVAAFVEHRYDLALDHFSRAQRTSPHSAYAWAFGALTHCYIGDIRKAERSLGMFRKLWTSDPYPHFFDTARCIVEAMGGNHHAAVDTAMRTIAKNGNFNATYRPLISSLGHLRRTEEAERYVSRLRAREPDFSIDWFRTKYPPLGSEAHEAYVEGFRKAGVPNA